MNRDFVRDALLQRNYFPNQKEKSPELPPCFETSGLTAGVAQQLRSAGPPFGASKGHDYAPYTLTRFNGGPRVCGIPHPYAYCRLVLQIHTSWNSLEPHLASDASAIQPTEHTDGRLFIMNYGSQRAKASRYIRKSSGAKFVAHADISNFFPSIYTHAIPWAVVGVDAAKKQGGSNKWYDKLDKLVRDCRRAETNGISIGPGTSSLIAELLLCKIDRTLQKKFSFDRFIDDYTAYCESRSKAEQFIRLLEFELSRFNLFLNFNKTSIADLPSVEIPEWIDVLRIEHLSASPDIFELRTFISRAIYAAERFPDGSVLRYAVNALAGKTLGKSAGKYLIARLLGMCLNRLHICSSLPDFVKYGYDKQGNFTLKREIAAVVNAAAASRRSDAMCWALWLARETNTPLDQATQEKCRKVYDVFATVLLYMVGSPTTRGNITRWVRKRVLNRPASVQERNWFLIHYLLNEGRLTINEVKDLSLRELRKQQVQFYT
jgi:hypothetical protein